MGSVMVITAINISVQWTAVEKAFFKIISEVFRSHLESIPCRIATHCWAKIVLYDKKMHLHMNFGTSVYIALFNVKKIVYKYLDLRSNVLFFFLPHTTDTVRIGHAAIVT